MHKNLLAAGGLILLAALLGCGGPKTSAGTAPVPDEAPLVTSEGTNAPVLREPEPTAAPEET